jgi:anti-anti-sigma factor
MALKITTVVTGQVAEMTLAGELDATQFKTFEKELEGVAASKPTELVLRLKDLTYLASAGIRMLLMTKQRLHWGGTVYVIAPQEGVRQVIERSVHGSFIIQNDYPAAG